MGVRLFSPRPAEGPRQLANTEQSPAGLPHGRWREASALLLFTGSAFVALALASYRIDPEDPLVQGSNWMGLTGGAVARVLVQGFGAVAWLAPLELGLIARPLIRGRLPPALGLR